MSDAATPTAPQPVMPLFYKQPAPVNLERHGDFKIKQQRSFAYAAKAHAVPVILDEVPLMQGYYPLVFTPGDNPALVGLLGLRPEQSLMVKPDGTWRRGWPVPAYVSRYPFILVQVPNDDRMVLVMEEDRSVVGPDGDLPLFENGQGTKHGQDILNYCGNFNRSVQFTQEFCKEMQDRDLLIDQRADLVTASRKQISLSGFRIVDEKKLNELPDEVILEWRKKKWLGLVYAHLLSIARLNDLLTVLSEEEGGPAQAGNAA